MRFIPGSSRMIVRGMGRASMSRQSATPKTPAFDLNKAMRLGVFKKVTGGRYVQAKTMKEAKHFVEAAKHGKVKDLDEEQRAFVRAFGSDKHLTSKDQQEAYVRGLLEHEHEVENKMATGYNQADHEREQAAKALKGMRADWEKSHKEAASKQEPVAAQKRAQLQNRLGIQHGQPAAADTARPSFRQAATPSTQAVQPLTSISRVSSWRSDIPSDQPASSAATPSSTPSLGLTSQGFMGGAHTDRGGDQGGAAYGGAPTLRSSHEPTASPAVEPVSPANEPQIPSASEAIDPFGGDE